MSKSLRIVVALAVAATCCAQAVAQVAATDAWVRGTVPGQKSTGAYMQLRASTATTLVGVSSPIAGGGEVHSMTQAGGVMRMRVVPSLPLPAGSTVAFEPNGTHLMLLDVRRPLADGETVPVVLTLRDARGSTSSVEVRAKVRGLGAPSHEAHGHDAPAATQPAPKDAARGAMHDAMH